VVELALDSRFTHYSVPELCQSAYLKAQTYNTSDYPFLASDNVSIFFDSNFVCTSTMKCVAPGEEFESFLGIDPAVKVEQKQSKKIRDKKGIFSKTNEDSFSVVTTIKNTKKVPVKIVVRQSLPLSSDKQIKVLMLSPTEEEVKAGAAKVASLCEQEEKGMIHKLHQHPLKKLVEPNNKGWKCNNCKGRTFNRYNCINKCDFDLCETCWESENGLKNVVTLDGSINALEWNKVVEAGKDTVVPFSYTLQWPLGQNISVK